jgi:hypothetical protein
MLHELESGVDWLLNQESSQATLLHTWDTRSKFIQVTLSAGFLPEVPPFSPVGNYCRSPSVFKSLSLVFEEW